MQFAAGADTVGCVTAVQTTEIQRGIRHGEGIVVEAFFQGVAQHHNAANGVVHQLNGIDAARRIAGVA
ncbi:hypothetical protein D3C80_1592030 [compost metagenome]